MPSWAGKWDVINPKSDAGSNKRIFLLTFFIASNNHYHFQGRINSIENAYLADTVYFVCN